MASPINSAVQDAKIAGTFVKSAGTIVTLSIVVAILSISLVVSMVTAKVGTDRYTGTDHKEFVTELKADTSIQLDEQQQVNDKVDEKLEGVSGKVDQIGKDVAVTKSKVTGMEKDLAEIKSILLRR